ncbi:hypothetical protein RIF29_04411 [Crotalaria pallida]|uniref:Uncharacterized protein n=1 Tax=Crotalaria pallida TaxID=3830 RepID=A0AAN9P995_CROPI
MAVHPTRVMYYVVSQMLSRVHLTGRVLHPSVQLCTLCNNALLTHYNQSNTGLMHGAVCIRHHIKSALNFSPGLNSGLANVELALALLLYHVDWRHPNGMENEDLDITEEFGVSVTRKGHLPLISMLNDDDDDDDNYDDDDNNNDDDDNNNNNNNNNNKKSDIEKKKCI